MAISVVSGSAGSEPWGTLANSWAVTGPTGLAEGDLLVISLLSSSLANETAPAGFTALIAGQAESTSDAELIVYYKFAGPSEAGPYTFTFDNTENGNAAWIAFRGVDQTTPLDVAVSNRANAASTSISTPTITTVTNGAMVLGIVACDPDNGSGPTFTWSSGTEDWDESGSTLRFQSGAHLLKTTAGSTSLSGTLSQSEASVSAIMAFRPATSSPQTVNPSGLGTASGLGAPTVTPGAVSVGPGGLAVPSAIGGPTLTPGTIAASPAGYGVAVSLGAPTMQPGAVSVSPAGLAVPRTFGAPTVAPAAVSVSPSGLGVAAAAGTPTMQPGSVTVSPAGKGVTVALGVPTMQPGSVSVAPGGIAVPRSIGTPTITALGVSVLPGGLGVPVAFGATPSMSPGPVTIRPTVTKTVEPFAYTDGNLVGKGSWVASLWGDATAVVSSGRVATGAADGSWRGADLPGPYGYGAAEFTMAVAPVANRLEFYCLFNPGETIAYLTVTATEITLLQAVSAAYATLAVVPVASADGDRLRLEYDANELRLYRNGAMLARSDHTIPVSSGRVGFDTNDAALRLDDLVVYEHSGIAVPVAYGSPSVITAQAVTAAGKGVAVALGAPTVAPGAVAVAPAGLRTLSSFGSPSMVPGPVTVAPGGVSVPVASGTPGIGVLVSTLFPPSLAVPLALGQPVPWRSRDPRSIAGQDRRVQESVLLRAANGYWCEVGKGVARGIAVEGLQVGVDRSGPLSASFTLRRDPSHSWPELGAFNEAVISLAGVPVWSGRVREAPGSSGDDDTISVSGSGWQVHQDDDLVSVGFVHSRISEWRDGRDIPYSVTAWSRTATLSNEGGGAVWGWPIGVEVTQNTGVGVTIDTGAHHPGVRQVVGRVWAENGVSAHVLYVRLHDTPDPHLTGSFTDLVSALDQSTLSGSVNSPTVVGGGTPASRGYRYVTVFSWQAGASGTTGASHMLHADALVLFSDPSYEVGNESDLTASDVVNAVARSGSLPLLSDDLSGIEPTSFPIPDYWPEAFTTPRQVLEAVNAYHDYQLGVDAERRLFFRAPSDVPVLESGEWSGASMSDASSSSGDDVYNKVVVDATGADGLPLQVVRYSADALPEVVARTEVGGISNPSFETNTSGWSASLAGTTLTRTTGTWSHYEGSAGLTVGTTNTYLACEVQTTVSGLEPGRSYSIRIPHNSEVGAPAGGFIYEWYAAIFDGVGQVAKINRTGYLSGWQVDFLSFIATDTSMTLRLGALVPAPQVSGGFAMFNVDALRIYQVEANVVDRHGFARAARLPVSAALTEAGADQIGVTWLRNHATTPLKGSLSVTANGGVRTVRGGAPLHPGHLLLYYGAAIRLANLEDPDTGGWGRVGRVASVNYDHDSQTASVEIDNERHRYEALLSRLAAVAGQVG